MDQEITHFWRICLGQGYSWNKHDYLVMTLNYSLLGVLRVNMTNMWDQWLTLNILKSSHADSEVNHQCSEWLKKKYASDEIGWLKVMCWNKHDYLAMTQNYSVPGVLRVNMTKYARSTIENFIDKLEGSNRKFHGQNNCSLSTKNRENLIMIRQRYFILLLWKKCSFLSDLDRTFKQE